MGYVYLIKCEWKNSSQIKFGSAKNWEKRIGVYNTFNPFVEVLATFNTTSSDKTDGKDFEHEIQKQFVDLGKIKFTVASSAAKESETEWFEFDSDKAIEIFKQIIGWKGQLANLKVYEDDEVTAEIAQNNETGKRIIRPKMYFKDIGINNGDNLIFEFQNIKENTTVLDNESNIISWGSEHGTYSNITAKIYNKYSLWPKSHKFAQPATLFKFKGETLKSLAEKTIWKK